MNIGLGAALGGYLAALLGLAWWAQSRIDDVDSYLVAGRRLGLPLASATILATWFGAGTILTATDEIRVNGLRVAAMEPIGAGLSLLFAGMFFAKPLWELKLHTISDFFRDRFNPTVETLSVVLTVPGYIGWVSVQLMASAGILSVYFDWPIAVGIGVVGILAIFYTWVGGMWSVTLTDSMQMLFIIVGLVVLFWNTLTIMGDGSLFSGLALSFSHHSPEVTTWVPTGRSEELWTWLTLLSVASLGNIPGQDLAQRIFSARSPKVARQACFVAGGMYLILGLVPIILALASKHLLDGEVHSVIATMAGMFLSPFLRGIFILALLSAVLSTIDSAILAAATLLSKNVLSKHPAFQGMSLLKLTQITVVIVGMSSIGLALVGESAYSLLEAAYASGFVTLLLPLVVGLFVPALGGTIVVWSMLAATGVWVLEWFFPSLPPMALIGFMVGGLILLIGYVYQILPRTESIQPVPAD